MKSPIEQLYIVPVDTHYADLEEYEFPLNIKYRYALDDLNFIMGFAITLNTGRTIKYDSLKMLTSFDQAHYKLDLKKGSIVGVRGDRKHDLRVLSNMQFMVAYPNDEPTIETIDKEDYLQMF